MAAESLIDVWGRYRNSVYRYYDIAGSAFSDGRELAGGEVAEADRALQRVVRWSEALTEIGTAQLRLSAGVENDRVALCLLAAGAVDIAVACEALPVCPDSPTADPVFAGEEAHRPEESALDLLERANELFSDSGGEPDEGGEPDDGENGPGGSRLTYWGDLPIPGGGAAVLGGGGLAPLAGGAVDPTRLELQAAADRSLDDLTDAAVEPACKFTSPAISGMAGGFHLAAALDPLHRLTALAEHVGVVKRRLVRLLASGFRKLLGISGQASGDLVGRAVRVVETKAVKLTRAVVQGAVKDALAWLVNCGAAKQEVERMMLDPDMLQGRGAASTEAALAELVRAYAREMDWTAKIGKWLSWAAPFISTLAVHVGGPLLVIGLCAVGLGFVLYTLDVRVDARGLPTRVSGVVQIVELA